MDSGSSGHSLRLVVPSDSDMSSLISKDRPENREKGISLSHSRRGLEGLESDRGIGELAETGRVERAARTGSTQQLLDHVPEC
ncbi:hypothetical protein N7462_003955 [Penicillium macrosclerotiorum]|uniref:uncharacterized protein n=1 Tax=Penicillium macrosclerotiorum TaxID=303699 RepID=UPI002547D00F|nr:uncharacterized protein N7462_003955 [Penicillium macrosclerotiorum]KAJ5689563.1 hypothetical protein N7462_003955 [Penicillium macrosclerotiorum]